MASINVLPPPTSANSEQFTTSSGKGSSFPVRGRVGTRQQSLPSSQATATTKKRMSGPEKKGRRSFDNPEIRIDPSSYRNTLFHNVCTAMLADSYHKSFTELFTIVQQQREEHKQAGPAAILLSPLIEDKEDKLRYLQARLSDIEEASRIGDLDAVYMAQREVALQFDQMGDHWLGDHFHNRCLETGCQIKGDNRRKEGEAHFHVGLAYENRGDLHESVRHMETFHELAANHSWHTESGESLHRIACEHLRRIYTTIADKADESSTKIEYLQKAHLIAKEGRDTYQEGLASHRLGCAYETIQDYDTAIQCHKSFLERSRYHGDEIGVGKAYEALARCHESKGDLENAVKCLELYVEVAERSGASEPVANACSAAGIMFNSLGDYKKAVEYFSKCYTICQTLDNKPAMETARVHYGIAQTHYNMMSFTSTIGNLTERDIVKMLTWKQNRIIPEKDSEKEDEKGHEDEEEGERKGEEEGENVGERSDGDIDVDKKESQTELSDT